MLPFDRWIRRGLRKTMDETLRDPEAVRAAGLAPEAVGRLWRASQLLEAALSRKLLAVLILTGVPRG